MDSYKGPDPEDVEIARERADSCCTCRRCQKSTVHPSALICNACEPIVQAERESARAEREAWDTKNAEARKKSLEKSVDIHAAEQLCSAMESISDEIFGVDWNPGLEFDLWLWVLSVDEGLNKTDSQMLYELHQTSGGWWIRPDVVNETERFVTTVEWKQILMRSKDA